MIRPRPPLEKTEADLTKELAAECMEAYLNYQEEPTTAGRKAYNQLASAYNFRRRKKIMKLLEGPENGIETH